MSRLMQTVAGILVVVTGTSGTAAAETIYVDAEPGRDCNGNYSPESRNCTGSSGLDSYDRLQEAANVVGPGDVVLVRQGTYHGTVSMKASGTQSQPILFQGYESEVATVSCATGCSGLFTVYWKGNGQPNEWIVWDNIDVKAVGTKYSIWVEGEHNVIMNSEVSHANNGIEGVGATCLDVMRSDHSAILNVRVHDCGWNGISISHSNDVVVEGVWAYDCPHHNCIQFFSGSADDGTVIYENNVARFNRSHDCRSGFFVRNQRNLLLEGNVISDTTRAGIRFTWAENTPGAVRVYRSDSQIFNNTIVGDNPAAETWERGISIHAATHLDIRNNIIGFHRGYEIDVDPAVDVGHVIDNNLYVGPFRARFAGTLCNSIGVWRDISPQVGANEWRGDAGFADFVARDFTLTGGSDAINTGLPLGDAHGELLDPATGWPDDIRTLTQAVDGWEVGAYVFPEEEDDESLPSAPSGLHLLEAGP